MQSRCLWKNSTRSEVHNLKWQWDELQATLQCAESEVHGKKERQGSPAKSAETEQSSSQILGLRQQRGANTAAEQGLHVASRETCISLIKPGWNWNIANLYPVDKNLFLFSYKWYHRARLSSESHHLF